MNQNKGIGAYQNRPGYFMGGMIGGAILGALVNKIQGKDWKRGALWGGLTGGITGGMTGKGGIAGWLQTPGGADWLKAGGKPGLFKTMLSKGLPFIKENPWVTGALGAGGAMVMGDPAYDRRKQEEYIAAQNEKDKEKKLKFYSKWFTNPWTGESMFNEGGIVNARPGYYNGGSAGMGGTWSDVPMEEGGPTQDPVPLQLPMGQEGSFESEMDDLIGLELAGLSDSERSELQSLMSLRLITPKDDPKYPQIEMRIQELMQGIGGETAMSEPHPDEGYYDMFFDENGRYPKDREELDLFLEGMDLDTVQAAQGGLMRLHAKDGLWANIHAKRKRIEGGSGETMRSPGSKGAPTAKALRESQATGGYMERPQYMGGGMSDIHPGTEDEGYTYDIDNKPVQLKMNPKTYQLYVDALKRGDITQKQFDIFIGRGVEGVIPYEKAQGGVMGYYGGGMSDMDLTRGGASFGPGTGTSDDIPAMLSDGEFVVTANAVKNLGGGNRMLGAKRMYQMMNSLDPNSQTPAEMDTTGIA